MVNNGTARHLYIEDLVPLVSAKTGVSQRQTRRTISAFCLTLGEQLGEGNDITLRGFGRFRVAKVKSYWKNNLKGQRVAQKAYSKVYFSASENVQKKLNRHLREGVKHAKNETGT
jgi:nucleoid DNA-binding protein